MTECVPLAPTELRVDELLLRPWRDGVAEEADAVLCAYTDPEFRRWNTPNVPVDTPDDARRVLRGYAEGWGRGERAAFCVTDAASGAVLGHVALNSVDVVQRSAIASYWVLPGARGRGVAGRALGVLSRWGFGTAGLHRISLDHAVGHEASCRVAERCGYAYEGTMRGAVFRAGDRTAFRDAHLHARLAGDRGVPGR
ncbi:GNAT family N-acetyltransferase [Streptomyces sp. NPDC002851]